MRRDPVDFSEVKAIHAEIHQRLINWARWSRSGTGSNVAPMFRLYRSDQHWEADGGGIPVDGHDAVKVQKGVTMLPQPHRLSLCWFYISPGHPRRACQSLGVNYEGLARLVSDSRTMLVNRRV